MTWLTGIPIILFVTVTTLGVVLGLVLWIMIRHASPVLAFVAKFPSTNGRIIVTIVMAVVFVLTALIADVLGHPLTEGTRTTIALLLTGWAGLDVTQFGIKRKTHEESKATIPPITSDIEDAPAIAAEQTPEAIP